MSAIRLRFAEDKDLLEREGGIERAPGEGWHPRTDRDGNTVRSWDRYHGLAMEEIERRLRTHRATPQVFELGKLSQRSRDGLRPSAACLALSFLFHEIDDQGGSDSVFYRKEKDWWAKGQTILDAEAQALDYDFSGDGNYTYDEQQRPFPNRFIRG